LASRCIESSEYFRLPYFFQSSIAGSALEDIADEERLLCRLADGVCAGGGELLAHRLGCLAPGVDLAQVTRTSFQSSAWLSGHLSFSSGLPSNSDMSNRGTGVCGEFLKDVIVDCLRGVGNVPMSPVVIFEGVGIFPSSVGEWTRLASSSMPRACDFCGVAGLVNAKALNLDFVSEDTGSFGRS
jgi:hypothetical protein